LIWAKLSSLTLSPVELNDAGRRAGSNSDRNFFLAYSAWRTQW
jgi:hypothetical protein